MEQVKLTQNSYNKLKEELNYLTTTERVNIAKNLKIAAEYGDLRENSEYDAEKHRQSIVEARITNIQSILSTAIIIDEIKDIDKVSIGNYIELLDIEFDEKITYLITDKINANPIENKISYESPVGKAILNKKVKDIINVPTPMGEIKFKILSIN